MLLGDSIWSPATVILAFCPAVMVVAAVRLLSVKVEPVPVSAEARETRYTPLPSASLVAVTPAPAWLTPATSSSRVPVPTFTG